MPSIFFAIGINYIYIYLLILLLCINSMNESYHVLMDCIMKRTKIFKHKIYVNRSKNHSVESLCAVDGADNKIKVKDLLTHS